MSVIKEKLHVIKKNIQDPSGLVFKICNYDHYQFAPLFSDKIYIKAYYKRFMGKKLTSKQLRNPKTFNEKLNWLKLHDRNPLYTTMADKVEGKKYIADKIGGEYVIPTIGVYDSVDKVPFDDLPEQYVIKCNHDSGSTFVCRDRTTFDERRIKKELYNCLKKNYYWASREPQYKEIKPRVVVEKYMEECENGKSEVVGLTDYKFYCFNGKARYLYVSKGLENHKTTKLCFLNIDWTLARFQRMDYKLFNNLPEKPKQYSKMIEIAEMLSTNIPFLRVDLYEINQKIYVGELTFFPGGGVSPYTNDGDEIMGSLLVLPSKRNK